MSDSYEYDDMRELVENQNSPRMYVVNNNTTVMSQNERRLLFVKNRINEIKKEEQSDYYDKLLLKFNNELIELEKN